MVNILPKQEGLKKGVEVQEQPDLPERAPDVEVEPVQVEQAQETEATDASESTINSEVSTASQKTLNRKVPVMPTVHMDRLEKEIEGILEEDLKELYMAMTPEQKAVFREKGEETRLKVRDLVSRAHINTKKVFLLIRGWLKLIPGVNRFFLEQEAKIKTDKILMVSEEEQKQKQNDFL